MKKLVLILSLIPSIAIAQQAEQLQDTKYGQRSTELLQIQRNQALDNAVVSEARARFYAEELLTAKNKIKDLENELTKVKSGK